MMRTSNRRRRVATTCCVAALLTGCGSGGDEERNVVRGRGLQPATLSEEAQVALYRAAIAASFEPGPGLTVLLHPRRLPRTAGLEGGAPVPQSLLAKLRAAGVVQGSCEPPGTRDTPQCSAPAAGYVVRGSDVFRAAGDTVQLHLVAERYATPSSGRQEALRFEKIYQLVPRGSEWRVAREARAPQ
jgi:hypothetical protein